MGQTQQANRTIALPFAFGTVGGETLSVCIAEETCSLSASRSANSILRFFGPLTLCADVDPRNVSSLPQTLGATLVALAFACSLHRGGASERSYTLTTTAFEARVGEVDGASGLAVTVVKVSLVGAGFTIGVRAVRGDAEAAVDAVLVRTTA